MCDYNLLHPDSDHCLKLYTIKKQTISILPAVDHGAFLGHGLIQLLFMMMKLVFEDARVHLSYFSTNPKYLNDHIVRRTDFSPIPTLWFWENVCEDSNIVFFFYLFENNVFIFYILNNFFYKFLFVFFVVFVFYCKTQIKNWL